MFALAIELANRSPADPRTLIRAARDFAVTQPDFAMAAGMTALNCIMRGYGYNITGADVLDEYAAMLEAASTAGVDEVADKADVVAMISNNRTGGEFVQRVLAYRLSVLPTETPS
jgi:hypothetical protein